MHFFDKFKDSKWVPYTIATCSAVILFVILTNISFFLESIGSIFGVIKPVLIAVVLAYIMDPIARGIEFMFLFNIKKDKIRRELSVALDIVLVLMIFCLLVWAVIPQLLQSIGGFIENNGDYAKNLEQNLQSINDFLFAGKVNMETFTYIIETILTKVGELFSKYSSSIISKSTEYVSGLMNFVVAFILAIYFLMDKDNLMKWAKKLMKVFLGDRYESLENFCYRCNTILTRYIECDLIEGFIVGIVNMLFMTLMGMPYGSLISVVVGVTNLAPTFGPLVGGFIGAFILVLIRPWYAFIFIIFTIILQTID